MSLHSSPKLPLRLPLLTVTTSVTWDLLYPASIIGGDPSRSLITPHRHFPIPCRRPPFIDRYPLHSPRHPYKHYSWRSEARIQQQDLTVELQVACVDRRAGQECLNSRKRKAPSTSKTWDSTGHAQRRNRGWKGYGSEGYEGTIYSDDTSIDTPADSDSEMSWRTIESIRDMPEVPLSIHGWRQQVGAFEQEDPAAVDDEQLDPGIEERSDDE